MDTPFVLTGIERTRAVDDDLSLALEIKQSGTSLTRKQPSNLASTWRPNHDVSHKDTDKRPAADFDDMSRLEIGEQLLVDHQVERGGTHRRACNPETRPGTETRRTS